MTPDDLAPYDAVLLLSFGGPEGPDDVVPFLRNVTRGRGIPDERLVEVGAHYALFGGRSPINDQNRELKSSMAEAFAPLPVYWGNRNWHPFLADTIEEMAKDGVRRAAVFVTSAYSSYSGCRQYREDLAAAVDTSGVEVDRLRAYFNHPGFIEPMIDNTLSAIAGLEGVRPHLVFVTHSVPTAYNEGSGPEGGAYVRQHESVRAEILRAVEDRTGIALESSLAFCSRSGAPHIPWLEPDVNDHLHALKESGTEAVVVIPIGFVSDHMEVLYDLDREAAATAAQLGLGFARAATCGTDPRFVAMIVDLVKERAAAERGEAVDRARVGSLGPAWDLCVATCCPNPQAALPVVGEAS